MHVAFDDLFRTLQESCDAPTWSKGVEISRSSRVMLESEDREELVLLVAPNARSAPAAGRAPRPARVRLYPADEDWTCDCGGGDPCSHAAGAAIAYRLAARRGEKLPTRAGGKPGHVGYRLTRTPRGLSFDRVIVQGDEESPLVVTLAALETGRTDGPNVEAAQADKRVEIMLGGHVRGVMPRYVMARLLDALTHCRDARLDGVPVTTSTTRSIPHGRLIDHPEGFYLYLEQDPAIVEVFANGVVLLDGGVLQAVGEPPLSGKEIEELRRGRVYRKEDVTFLATEVVPSLSARLPFEVRTPRLPRLGGRTPVFVLIETSREDDSLAVLPLLVYGDPPLARVDAGKLVPLGDVVPARNVDEERALARRLQAALGLEVGRRAVRTGADALALAEALERWRGGELKGDGHRAFFRAQALTPSFQAKDDDFEIDFVAGRDERRSEGRAPAGAVLRAWRQGESMVALEGGGMSPLPLDWLERFGSQLADLLAAKEACGGRMPPAGLPDLARLCDELERPRPPGFERLRGLVEPLRDGELGGGVSEHLGWLPKPSLPGDLAAELRSYQLGGVRWLSFLREAGLGALLADDMGLGKTIQTLCALEGRTLVVAPASVVHCWADEAAKFRPGLNVSVYHGAGRKLEPAADLTITTYAILRIDAELLASTEWDTIVLDEAQAIKNPDSQVARAAFRLRAGFRVALTGTPVENRLSELWSQMHFINPGLLGGRADFEARYSKPIESAEPGVAARLRARVRPFVLRRTKAAVAPELPPRTDIVLRCSLGEEERLVYQAVRAAAREEVVGRLSAGGSVLEALEALLRMRQAACHPALVPGQRAETSAKVELLMETLEEALSGGHKALVFSQWTGLLDLLEPRMRASGVEFTRLDGSTRDRAAVVRGFQAEGGPPVMLVSLMAGGTGLTLTAADHVFLLDPWWNPAVEDQAAGRAHRIGQTRPVMVHKLVAEDTVEERILGLQAHKRQLFEAALGEGTGGAGLTREDILALLD